MTAYNIRGEVLKAGGEVTVQWLTAIVNAVWRTGMTHTNRMEESNHYPNLQERQQKSMQELQRNQSAKCAWIHVWEDVECHNEKHN